MPLLYEQVVTSSNNWATETVKHLITGNTAGLVGVTAIMGADKFPGAALCFFVGVVFSLPAMLGTSQFSEGWGSTCSVR